MTGDRGLYLRLLEKVKRNESSYGRKAVEYPSAPDGRYFRASGKRVRPLGHICAWTPSFFIAPSILRYKDLGDEESLGFAESFYPEYLEKVADGAKDTMHDLGFLYSLYSVMLYKLTGERRYADLSVLAADALARRFVPPFIKAWGRMDNTVPDYIEGEARRDRFFAGSETLAIIDTMMNLPLLLFAWRRTGDAGYLDVARSHARATRARMIRADGSVMHAYDYGRGEEDNDCGFAIGSCWARGAAWAIYGFALMGELADDEICRRTAEALFEDYLRRADVVPVWDFRLPEGSERALDTSAAVIVASATTLLRCDGAQTYRHRVLDGIRPYINLDPDVPGILSEQNGRHEYAAYGDYFLLELLSKEVGKPFSFW